MPLRSWAPILFVAATLTAFTTVRAQRSGKMLARLSIIRRDQRPNMFTYLIICRWVSVVIFVFIATAITLRWASPDPH